MKERGIIFNAEMVRAILDGRKTQTRRVMKPQPVPINNGANHVWYCDKIKADLDVKDALQDGIVGWYGLISSVCPFGGVGDRLWVRETFALLGNEDGVCVDWNDNILKAGEEQAARIYKASCEQKDGDYGLWSIPDDADWKPHTDNHKYEGTWTPSIHMPRWASRITLEITDVRVERLQAASDDDFKAEGYPLERALTGGSTDAFCWFRHLWDSVSKPDCNFESNPWVWVIEFKRV
ncbi:hypothetical protein AB6H26_11135 [Providencia hangzhouensis]|uniref:hypothetical protein n=1 Tax=Providencia hangzhouensis TaxID=3031799 RepID=UPI0034DD7155